MTAIRTKARLMAAVSLFSLFAAPVLAQETPETATSVDEIIVTLQKREQSIQDVPAAVTAYDSGFLEDIGIDEFTELAAFVPGFEVQNQSPNNPGFVIRGITSDALGATEEPRVSVYQDGVSISRTVGAYVELFDIARVEVAKGPQSTLFGRGALIGAVNVIQAKADTSSFEAMLRAEVGNYDYRLAELMVNMPLSDSFAVRFSARIKEREGFVESLYEGEDFNSTDTSAARLAFNWTPTDAFSADLLLNYQVDRPAATSFKSMAFSPTNPMTGAVLGGRTPQEGAALNNPRGLNDTLGLDRELYSATLLAEYDFNDALSLSSITAFRDVSASEVGDSDGISLNIIGFERNTQGDQFSQEFRLNWDDGGRISGFVGVNYFREDGVDTAIASFDERVVLAQLTGQLNAAAAGSGLPATTPAPEGFFANTAFTGALLQGLVAGASDNPATPAFDPAAVLAPGVAQAIAANLKPFHLERSTNSQELESWDIFGDVTLEVTDRFQINAGLRYTRDEKDVGISSSVLNGRSILGSALILATGAGQAAAAGSAVGVAQFNALLNALAAPGAANIPTSMAYPVPLFGLTFQPTANNGDATVQSIEDEGATWRLTGLYEASDDLNLYASYARGRRPELLSPQTPAPGSTTPLFSAVEAETVDSYEVGAKLRLPEQDLSFDGAVFYYTYENFQTTEQRGTQFITTNAGQATSYGFEGQATWRPTEWVDLFGTYAYNRSRFESGVLDGNQFRLSPDHSFSLGASVRFNVAGGEIAVRPTYTWQSKTFFENDNDLPGLQTRANGKLVPDTVQEEFQDGFGLLNVRVAYAPAAGNWGAELFVENALEEEYIIDAGNTGDLIGLPTFIAGPPRLYGARLTLRY